MASSLGCWVVEVADPASFRFLVDCSGEVTLLLFADFTSGISLFAPDGSFEERISFVVNVPGTPFGGRPGLPLADGSIGVVVLPATKRD